MLLATSVSCKYINLNIPEEDSQLNFTIVHILIFAITNQTCVFVQVISSEKSRNHIFRLTGPGADQDPKGLFTIDLDTGDVSVRRSLDREAIDSYRVSPLVCVFVCFCPSSPPGNSFLQGV